MFHQLPRDKDRGLDVERGKGMTKWADVLMLG